MITPFLNFHGQCEEAVRYYQTIFGFEEPRFLKFKMAPNRGFEVSSDFDDKIMFTFFIVSNTQVMACDHYPGLETTSGQTMSLNIIHDNKEELFRWFELLSKDGQVGMSPQETAWAPLYASCIDKYNVVWQFSHNA